MVSDPVFVGIDVSKARLDIHLHPEGTAFSVANDGNGIAALVRRLAPFNVVAVGLEASGGYERRAARCLHGAGLPVFVLAPKRVRDFAGSLGQNAKTDPIDAEMVARYLQVAYDRLSPYTPDLMAERLAELNAYRRRLIDEQTQIKGQLDTIETPFIRRMNRRRLASVRHALAVVEREIARTIEADAGLHARARCLRQELGVGPVCTTTLLAEMPELGHISAKAAAALVGVAPHARQSGQSQYRGRCGGGRKKIRDVLYMATLSAIKAKHPTLEPFYRRLIQNGKPFKLALTAAIRKFITILNAIARDHPAFQTTN